MAGVYISYPFCGQKCTYCNFASGVMPASLEPRYREALAAEIRAHRWSWRPETVYLGGGTPSRMDCGALKELLDALDGQPWREATIEAAPGDISAERAAGWVRAGINRVSLGVQSFVQPEIAATGRKHTAEVVAAEVARLSEAGIASINIDLIAGLAGQTRASWSESLDWVERLEVDHVSVYMLEVDEDSRLGRELLTGGERYGAGAVPDDELIAESYQTAVERLASIGIERYEISNFARPGRESLHNLKYWKLEPYIGFGADAHSFDGRERWQNVEDLREYLRRSAAGESVVAERSPARPEQERFFVGMRLSEGIVLSAADWKRFGGPISQFIDTGLLERTGDRLRLTGRGVLLSNEVFQEFVGV